MKSSKERKMERKRKSKELSATKTVKSRQRRLDNKAKRDEIHAIDPDMKVNIVNQIIYDEHGIEIQVINGKITNVLELAIPEAFEPEIVEAADEGEVNVIEKIETRNKSALQRLTNKLKKISL